MPELYSIRLKSQAVSQTEQPDNRHLLMGDYSNNFTYQVLLDGNME